MFARNQCEDLRSILSKRHQDEVCRDRAEQLRLKEEERKKEQEVEMMYAQLWDEDRQAKCKREEMEAALQIERNRDILKVCYPSSMMRMPLCNYAPTLVDINAADCCQ